MAGDVRLPQVGHPEEDYGTEVHGIVEATNSQLDGKRVPGVVLIDPTTGLPALPGAAASGAITIADGGAVALGATADLAGDATVVGQLKAIAASVAVPSSYTRSDTFTVAASGTTVDATANPAQAYSLQVTGTGAAASAWSVVLEGSLTGATGTWTTLLTHGTSDGNGGTKSVGSLPMRYVRSRLVSVTLGSATNVVARLLAKS